MFSGAAHGICMKSAKRAPLSKQIKKHILRDSGSLVTYENKI